MMKEDPALNHNSSVASYGMAATIPDGSLFDQFIKDHSAVLLDTL